jgi:hypothetical protein
MQGAWALFVIMILTCIAEGHEGGLLAASHLVAFILGLVAFVVALTNYPYTAGCAVGNSEGCDTLKAAMGIDCALWY